MGAGVRQGSRTPLGHRIRVALELDRTAPCLLGRLRSHWESRWLDLPATTSGGFPVLSSDGTALAYWASMGDTGTRTDGRFPAPTELRLLDLTTGDEQRWAPETRHGLSTFGMAWAGDTLWFKAGAYRDAGRNSAEVGLHTWRRGSTARDVSDLHTSQVNLTTATTDARGFLAGAGTASSKTWRGTAAGGLGRLVLDTSGTVSSPAMSPDGRLVAGIRQGRTEQTYGVAGQLLVGEVVDGHARMRPAVPVQTAFVLGWRSPSEVVVMHASAGATRTVTACARPARCGSQTSLTPSAPDSPRGLP